MLFPTSSFSVFYHMTLCIKINKPLKELHILVTFIKYSSNILIFYSYPIQRINMSLYLGLIHGVFCKQSYLIPQTVARPLGYISLYKAPTGM